MLPHPSQHISSTKRGKILVIRGGAIGDFILTLPAISALRTQFPYSHLELLGYPHIAQLALEGGLVDALHSIEARALAGFFAAGGTLEPELVSYFAGFALILSYLYDPDLIFHANVTRCTPAQFIAGPHRPDDRGTLHATEVFLQPLERLAIFSADRVPQLKFAPALDWPSASSWIALHPGSGSERKNWPEARWAELIRQLGQNPAWHILLVGGEAEGARLARLAALVPEERLRVAQSLPLTTLAAQLAHCRAFLGHDSGISHLAGALGLSGLVLWGETNAAVWRPPSPSIRLLRDPAGLLHLSVERVRAALEQLPAFRS